MENAKSNDGSNGNGDSIKKQQQKATVVQQQQYQKKKRPFNGNQNTFPKKRSHFGQHKPVSNFVLQQERMALPIYKSREDILKAFRENQIVAIQGETGCGKTTQIPQYLYETGFTKNGCIAITQPRRVAAITLAARVAAEMGVSLGRQVGYTIRFEDVTSEETKIKYMTDGMLLRELLLDTDLTRYTCIILDEAHERSVRTDILFGLLKRLQKRRHNLKIAIMSATLDAEKFSQFFDNAPILHIPGRTFPITSYFTASPQQDYLDGALVTIFQVHVEEKPGDILVFLTGQEEIESMEKLLLQNLIFCPPTTPKMIICPLYSALPPSKQMQAFESCPPGCRKVILSTNIAETSVTISGIRYVIDTGVVKERNYNAKLGTDFLIVQPVSKAAVRQREGRAGREAPGTVYHLYTEATFEQLNENTVPEIQRSNLSNILLILKAANVNNVLRFDYIDPPPRESVEKGLGQLYALGALTDEGKLSELGKRMSVFPLEPMQSKMLLSSIELKCTYDIVALISLLSVDSLFHVPSEKREKVQAIKNRFNSSEGDHYTLLNVFKAYMAVNGDSHWCHDHYINTKAMTHVMEMFRQIERFCHQQNITLDQSSSTSTATSSSSTSTSTKSSSFSSSDIPTNSVFTLSSGPIARCLIMAYFQHIAVIQDDGTYKTLVGNNIVHIHPSSILFRKKAEYVVFHELVFTKKHYMRTVSRIDPTLLPVLVPHWFGRLVQKQ